MCCTSTAVKVSFPLTEMTGELSDCKHICLQSPLVKRSSRHYSIDGRVYGLMTLMAINHEIIIPSHSRRNCEAGPTPTHSVKMRALLCFGSILVTPLLLPDYVSSITPSSSNSSRRPPCSEPDSYICQHKILNDEILAAGDDTVKLQAIQQRLARLREKEMDERRRREELEARSRELEEEYPGSPRVFQFEEDRRREEELRRRTTRVSVEGVDEKTWLTVLACGAGIILIGCLISVISAGRHTGTEAGARGYQLDEPVTIGESLLRPPESTGYIATLVVTRAVPLRSGSGQAFGNADATEPPPDYEEAMRTGSQPPKYTPNG